MKANILERFGGTENFAYRDVETPQPSSDQVLVRIEATSASFADTMIRGGNILPLQAPVILGSEAAGVVESIGADVGGIAVGDRVFAGMFAGGRFDGGYASHVSIGKQAVFPLPDSVSFEDAAALGMNGIVALNAIRRVDVAGRSVVVHSAAGGIGSILLQLARHQGAAQVIAIVGSSRKAELVESLGAQTVIDSSAGEWGQAVLDATGGTGPDVIFDAVGGATSGRGLEVLAPGGTLVIYGAASGSPPQFSPTAMGGLALKMQTIAGYSMMPSLADANLGRLLREDFARLYALVESGALKPVIGRRLPLSEAAEAHRLIESRQSTGKILLVP